MWEDTWLPGDNSSRVPTPNINSDGLRVMDLIDSDTATWKVDVLQAHFIEEEVVLIQEILGS